MGFTSSAHLTALDFSLIMPNFAVLGFDIHHAQFIVQKHLGIGLSGSTSVIGAVKLSTNIAEEMHQQIAVFHRAEQCLEDAIYLGVYAVFHGGLF